MGSTIDAAQAVLTAFDTSMSRQWRQEDRDWRREDRAWRSEDLVFREEERRWFTEEQDMRHAEKRWRGEDIQQRHVDNARYLWSRFVEKNRRDVEEKTEQLKAISNLSALFAGFAVVNLTQFQVSLDAAPIWVIAIYGILTAATVCLNILGMVLCTLILGCILKNGKTYVEEEREEAFMFHAQDYISTFQPGVRPPAPAKTFDKFWEQRCEDDWRKAFNFFTWGVFSFLTSLIPISWIKFNYSTFIPACFTGIVALTIILWSWQQHNWGSYFVRSEGKAGASSAALSLAVGMPWAWHLAPLSTLDTAGIGHSSSTAAGTTASGLNLHHQGRAVDPTAYSKLLQTSPGPPAAAAPPMEASARSPRVLHPAAVPASSGNEHASRIGDLRQVNGEIQDSREGSRSQEQEEGSEGGGIPAREHPPGRELLHRGEDLSVDEEFIASQEEPDDDVQELGSLSPGANQRRNSRRVSLDEYDEDSDLDAARQLSVMG